MGRLSDKLPYPSANRMATSTERSRSVARLKADGVRFVQDPKDQGWLWREARLKDSDGNEICLFWAGENRRHPPWRLT